MINANDQRRWRRRMNDRLSQVTGTSRRPDRIWMVCASTVLLAACSTGTVVLLPEKDGHHTAVAVTQRNGEVVLDQPYAAAAQTPFGPRTFTSTPQEVQATFGAALAAQPARPKQFTLYFVEGTDELTDESK